MPALTIRNLPDEVHAGVRARAEQAGMSMESFVRRTLAHAAADRTEPKTMSPPGFAAASAAFMHAGTGVAETQPPGLWGALRGSVNVAADCDLTAPTGEIWSADT